MSVNKALEGSHEVTHINSHSGNPNRVLRGVHIVHILPIIHIVHILPIIHIVHILPIIHIVHILPIIHIVHLRSVCWLRESVRGRGGAFKHSGASPTGIAVVLLFPVLLLLLVLILKKAKCRRGGDPTEVKKNVSFLPPYKDKNVDELLAVRIQEAPLQSVLDNLDVLEELVMLLDPDSSVAKTTRHVATHCSFSATWINYAYSMRTPEPLKPCGAHVPMTRSSPRGYGATMRWSGLPLRGTPC
ncbi:IGF-like family receptor 1 [Anguilla rostrata]|uniref:IGF-like family receptor 1 n=1 Tax=Anguilla rostrata TaxID=7938 RepID=UPI0030CA9142